MRCYICGRADHLWRARRSDTNYITDPYVVLCWSCIRAVRGK